MPRKVDPKVWSRYFELRDKMSYTDAAKKAGINKTTAWRLENVPNYRSSGRPYLEAWRANNPAGLATKQRLNTQAKHALDDFATFRLRYFGRKSTKWQVATAEIIRQAHEEARTTLDRKFIVINCPPGAGKSTLVSHDIPLWLLSRDRSLRILIGSSTESLAGGYTEWMLTDLERTGLPPLSERQRAFGTVEAQACLVDDFGRFKPDNGRNWRTKAFRVSQPGDVEATGKEMSVTAFGRDSSYLGQRVDIALWDDLVTQETMGTTEAREKTLRKWQSEAEQRVEPGGVLFLIGQRLYPDDLYNYCINLPGEDEDGEEDSNSRKYTHIVFKAHYEEHCKGLHAKDAPAYDPADPENSGCLLEPLRLGWKHLRSQMRADEQNDTSIYRVTFQQEDGDPRNALVKRIWVDGGVDKDTGEMFTGCWDHNRVAGAVPDINIDLNVITIDSSPSNYWGIEWWVYDKRTECRYLVDIRRSKMHVTDAISYDKTTGEWSGLLERWWQSASAQGKPFTHIIFEIGSAERYFLQMNDFTDWARLRNVVALPHDTKRNKNDPDYGVQGLLPPAYRSGRVRLPGDVQSGSKSRALALVDEVVRWPDTLTFDCGMSQWFFEHNLPRLVRSGDPLPNQPRPAVVRNLAHRRLSLAVSSRRSA